MREKWTPGFFHEVHGDLTVAAACRKEWGQMKLRDFVERLEAARPGDDTPYLRTWNFLNNIPELRRDFSPGTHFSNLF